MTFGPLTDCGPCTTGAEPVRDLLPALLPASLRAYMLTRLSHGERLYGAPLRVGWEPAEVELRQELADAAGYAIAARRPVVAVLIGLIWRLL